MRSAHPKPVRVHVKIELGTWLRLKRYQKTAGLRTLSDAIEHLLNQVEKEKVPA